MQERRDRVGRLRICRRHLTSHQHVDLTAMIFVVRQALVYLRAGEIREAPRDETVHGLTGLQKPDHVVDADACAVDPCMTASHAGRTDNVTV